MKIFKADTMGFCPGVKLAISKTYEAIKLGKEKKAPVMILGQIVHNKTVSDSFIKMGVKEISELDLQNKINNIKSSVIVIPSHGVSQVLEEKLNKSGAIIIDATCPIVASNQKLANKLSNENKLVIIAGDKGHGETLGIQGHAKDSIVISNPSEAETLQLSQKAALMPQTTISETEYQNIKQAFQKRQLDIEFFGGICSNTEERQEAITKLREKIDVLIVIGGKNSANTRRLSEHAVNLGIKAFQIEGAHEIPSEIKQYKNIGITAGASTPDSDIEDVIKILQK